MTTPTTVNVQFQLRADTAANWTAANPTLLVNEFALETDTKKLKVGDGSTAWTSLAYFPSIVSGGTVLGNLEIGSTGTLTFEGSTADGFETTLAVTDPTADRTITLPDQSGTVVVSGNASIVDADIAAGAEIAVSKLANGTANQVLVTDGTDVSWSNDLTLAGNLTVNGTTTTVNSQTLVVKDKNIELGVIDTPTDLTADSGGITLKGATDKTINWVNATDSWTSSENIDLASGKSYRINDTEVLSATTLGSGVTSSSLTSVGTLGSVTVTGDATAGTFIPTGGTAPSNGLYLPTTNSVALSTNGTGRLFISSAGLVGIGTNLPEANFQINHTSTAPSLSSFAGSAATFRGSSTIRLSVGTYPAPNYTSWIQSADATGTAYPLLLQPLGGNVGIGNTGPSYKLDVTGGFRVSGVGTTAFSVDASSPNNSLIVDSSGRCLVGTSSTSQQLSLLVQGSSGGGTSGVVRTAFTGATPAADAALGSFDFSDSGHTPAARIIARRDGGTWTSGTSQPTRLEFSTTADGASSPTERMRITSGGAVSCGPQVSGADLVGTEACGFVADSVYAPVYKIKSSLTSDKYAALFFNGNGQVGDILMSGSSTAYNTSSDYRLKENVTPITDGITRLQQLKPSRFNFIADPNTVVDGFLAHEAQAAVPECVTGTKDEVDENGDPVYQGIDQSKLVPLLTAALQEAVTRIEQLEAAVATLQGS